MASKLASGDLVSDRYAAALYDLATEKNLIDPVLSDLSNLKNILNLKNNNNKIIGYGSPAKATTALNFFGISNEIECIVEDNKLKHGKYLPGMKIPIVSVKDIRKKPDYALVLAWNFFEEIKKKNRDLADKFISIKDLEN